jgi:hypothetical protein
MDAIQLAALLSGLILVASIASVELGVTVALIELTLGVVAGSLFDLNSQEWLDFLATFASIVLTFLAGMEVDPAYLRRRARASFGIGISSFIGPFVVAACVAYFALDWSGRASLIAGTALSTTSLAVVYAVLIERGLTDTRIGKLLMSATFVTDVCTALARRRRYAGSTSIPARKVSTIEAKVARKSSHSCEWMSKRFPAPTPSVSSISATVTPSSTEAMLATSISPERSAAS